MDQEKLLREYAIKHTSEEESILHQLYRETHLKTIYPRMISGHMQGLLLKFMSCMIKPERILEIGTFTGYSAICLANGLADNGLLHTIDINDELSELAAKYFRLTGLSEKIIQHTGNALDIIPGIDDSFDLVFIDGNKSEYPDYYKTAILKLKPGGYMLADNVLWNGKVLPEYKGTDKETRGIREFNDLVATDPNVEKLFLPLKDGIYLIRRLINDKNLNN